MTLTRDSIAWVFTAAGSLLAALLGHFDLLTKAFPGLSLIWQARIELFSFLISVVSGILMVSPLPLSYSNPQSGKSDSDFIMNPLNPKAAVVTDSRIGDSHDKAS